MQFVTYLLRDAFVSTPIAVDCEGLSEDEVKAIEKDALKYKGLAYVKINSTGRIRVDALIITPEKHYTHDWNEFATEYYYKHIK